MWNRPVKSVLTDGNSIAHSNALHTICAGIEIHIQITLPKIAPGNGDHVVPIPVNLLVAAVCRNNRWFVSVGDTTHIGLPNSSATSVRVLPISSPRSVKSGTIAPRYDAPPVFHSLLSNLESVRPHPQRRAAGIIVTRTNFGVFVLSTTRIIYLKSRLNAQTVH